MKRDDIFLYKVDVINHTCGEAPCEDHAPLVVLRCVLQERRVRGFRSSERRGGEVLKYLNM